MSISSFVCEVADPAYITIRKKKKRSSLHLEQPRRSAVIDIFFQNVFATIVITFIFSTSLIGSKQRHYIILFASSKNVIYRVFSYRAEIYVRNCSIYIKLRSLSLHVNIILHYIANTKHPAQMYIYPTFRLSFLEGLAKDQATRCFAQHCELTRGVQCASSYGTCLPGLKQHVLSACVPGLITHARARVTCKIRHARARAHERANVDEDHARNLRESGQPSNFT